MTRHLIGILILATAVLTGCGRENSPPPSPEQRAAADAGDKAAADTKIAADLKTAADLKAAGDLKAAADATGAAAKAAADDNAAKATSLFALLLQYTKDDKIELAEETLTQLDGMKQSLPASLQEKIESARTALAAKKAGAPALK